VILHVQDVDAAEKNSMLVVSEFVGCSPSVSGAIRVNPWSIDSLADGIYTAIKMPAADRHLRHDKHWRYVSQHTVRFWAQARSSSFSILLYLSFVGLFGIQRQIWWQPQAALLMGPTVTLPLSRALSESVRRGVSSEHSVPLQSHATRSGDAWTESDRTGAGGRSALSLGWLPLQTFQYTYFGNAQSSTS
jgi:hypothetical protein